MNLLPETPLHGTRLRAVKKTIKLGFPVLAAAILGPGALICRADDSHKPLNPGVEDLRGRPLNPLSAPRAKALLFIFVSVDCPVCNSYAPEYNRLKAEFSPKGITVELVYPNSDETAQRIKLHGREFGLTADQLRDPRHELVRAAGAKMMPEAALFVPGQGFVYCGRIDNRYSELGISRPTATEHDLRAALQCILEGRPVADKRKPGIGCSISPPT